MIIQFLWLALTVYHEARGEPDLGQLAVAHVVLNRADNRNLSVREVVLQDKQFSCYNEGVRLPQDWKAFYKAMENVTIAIQGHDFTEGATHYHEVRVSPYWTGKMEFVGQIGNHKFYRR